MTDTLQVKCPCCETILILEKRTGKVLEQRRPIIDQSTGDRYQDALKKVRERTSVAEEKFQKFKADRGQKMAKLDALFKEGVERAKDDDPENRKVNPLEMD